MTPLTFDNAGRELVGTLHQGRTPALGLVICGPYAQEHSRILRLQRVVANKAQRMGVSTLRFDYYGCGESMGRDDEGDLQGWIGDIHAADRRLREVSGCRKVAWLGMRLGATLAARAAATAPTHPDALVLWEPITDGQAYLETLRVDQGRMCDAGYGPNWRALPQVGADDAGGFCMGTALREQLQAMRWTPPPANLSTLLLANPGTTAAVHPLAPQARVVELSHTMDWVFADEGEISVVPADALNALLKELKGLAA